MKIAYISIDDPKDNISWSGLKLNIYRTLKLLKHEIKIVGPLKDSARLPYVIKREFLKIINLKYDSERKILLSKKYSKKILSEIRNHKIDLIFTSDSYLVSFLKTNIPIILWLDATYHTYHTHYYGRNKIHTKSFNEANYLEKLALKNSKVIILTSNWAKKKALENYNLNKRKIKIIPFGSNLKETKNLNLKKKINDFIQLTSIGVDWNRKGMNKSIQITKYLNDNGMKTNLNIVGCINKNIKTPSFVNQVGFLNKNKRNDNLKMKKILSNTDFHILMTKKEACGVVFAEANSFGIFNITNDVGGVRGMIKNNVNGKLFKVNDSPKKIGDFILKIIRNKKKFTKLKKKSKDYYLTKLSWKKNSSILQNIIISTQIK